MQKLWNFCNHAQLTLLVAFSYVLGALLALGTLKIWKLMLLVAPLIPLLWASKAPPSDFPTFARTCVPLPEEPYLPRPSGGVTLTPRVSQRGWAPAVHICNWFHDAPLIGFLFFPGSLPRSPAGISFTTQMNHLHSNPCCRICLGGIPN